MSKEKQIDIIRDLLVEFDEMGFIPTTTVPNPEAYAIKWRAEITKALTDYLKQSEGEWEIKSEIHQMLDDVDEELYVECPFCKRRFWVPYEFDDKKIFEYAREHYPYCNCGAKMKGGAE